MKINTFNYFFLDAIKGLKRNATLTIASVITISATFFIFGLFILYLQSVDKNIFIYNKEMVTVFRYVEVTVFILLPLISFILIVNQIKMVVFSRKNEISVMKFVGATDGFIRGPVIIQGIIIGIIGAFVANLSLFYVYSFISTKVMNLVPKLILVQPSFITNTMLLPFIIAGVFIWPIGSMIALRKILKTI